MSRRARSILIGFAVLALVAMGVIYLPARTWLDQQREAAADQARLKRLNEVNDELARKIDRLSDSSSIEQQAREQFGFRMPGEESYTVPPPKQTVVNLPPVWPFDLLQEPVARAAARQN